MNLFRGSFLRILPIIAIIGPGIISGNADNDAGGITTYSIAGANFGYSLLWVLLLTTIALAVTQEIGIRMGLASGKGLASLIREKFGLKLTALIMVIFLIANVGTTAAEFAGIAAALEIFNIQRYISVPIALVIIYIIMTKGSFRMLEKIFLVLSSFYIVYILSAIYAKPDWVFALKSLVVPTISFNKDYVITALAVVGTTITPWGQFFIQDYVVDKKLSIGDLKIERLDVFFGSFLTNFFSFFIIVACAASIFAVGGRIVDAKDAAIALKPIAGPFATILFSFGLLNASVFGACILPLTTAYVVTEAFGLESGLNYKYREAPEFYGILAVSLLIGGFLVAIPLFPLMKILFLVQVLNAILLIPIFIFVYKLANDKKILNGFSNNRIHNIILIGTLIAIIFASSVYAVTQFIK